MRCQWKLILTIALSFFAGVTLALQIGKEFRSVEPMTLPEGLNVICTHATSRCVNCTTIERLTRETLQHDFAEQLRTGKIVFGTVNFELPEANDFSRQYEVATASVILVDVRDGKTVAGVNLANESWRLLGDEAGFKAMLKERIEAMLLGTPLKADDLPEEIELDAEEIELPLF